MSIPTTAAVTEGIFEALRYDSVGLDLSQVQPKPDADHFTVEYEGEWDNATYHVTVTLHAIDDQLVAEPAGGLADAAIQLADALLSHDNSPESCDRLAAAESAYRAEKQAGE